jgi:intein-encoded DNA endonuclease-like protein
MPSRETIGHWALRDTSPFTGKNLFVARPSEELSFFLGAWLGVGWADENDGGKRMRLKVRSESFANEFTYCASVILSKSSPYHAWTTSDEGGLWYNAKVTSFALYEFVNHSLDQLKGFILPYPRGFLRGFFTAEGCPSVNVLKKSGPRLNVGVVVSNSDISLMKFCRDLLATLGFHPGKIRLNAAKGKKTNISIASMNSWLLTMSRLKEVRTFVDTIGFADTEKQQKVTQALRLIEELGVVDAGERWLQLYKKTGKRWKRMILSA